MQWAGDYFGVVMDAVGNRYSGLRVGVVRHDQVFAFATNTDRGVRPGRAEGTVAGCWFCNDEFLSSTDNRVLQHTFCTFKGATVRLKGQLTTTAQWRKGECVTMELVLDGAKMLTEDDDDNNAGTGNSHSTAATGETWSLRVTVGGEDCMVLHLPDGFNPPFCPVVEVPTSAQVTLK